MKSSKFTIPALIVTALAAPLCQAALTLQINPLDQTFSFVGSDTGTPQPTVGQGLTSWTLGGLGGSFDISQVLYNNDQAYSTTVGNPGNGVLGYDLLMTTNTDSGGSIYVNFGTFNSDPQTFTGLNNTQSYLGFGSVNRAMLESAIGSSLSLQDGTGFGSIDVVQVPEPSTMLLFGFAGAGIFLRRRKA